MGDPHPYCENCAEEAGKKLCRPSDPCDHCTSLRADDWDRILKARQKRIWRKKKRAPATVSTPPELPCARDEEEVTVEETEEEVIDLSQTGQEEEEEGHSSSEADKSEVEVRENMESPRRFSESDTESDQSGLVLTQNNDTQVKEEPATDMDPQDIEFPELLRFVASNSSFTVGDPTSSRPSSDLKLGSQTLSHIREPNFYALSMSQAFVEFAKGKLEEARTAPQANHLGHLPQGGSKTSMRTYQISSTDVVVTPAIHTDDRPHWMPAVLKNHRSYVKEVDLIHLESNLRESLLIQNSLEAFLSAVATASTNVAGQNPFVVRALSASSSALAELVKRTIASLQQVTMHRRDMTIWNTQLRPSQIGKLRYAPYLGEKFLFEPSILQQVSDERAEEQKQKAFANVAKSGLHHGKSGQEQYSKRLSASSPFSPPPPAKKAASDVTSPAVAKSSTPKTGEKRKHR